MGGWVGGRVGWDVPDAVGGDIPDSPRAGKETGGGQWGSPFDDDDEVSSELLNEWMDGWMDGWMDEKMSE